ncbi:MAG: hypothetical protein KIT31_03220 [Deltaproteobacteria bacterium]|nr:hypothetical protein [Deltaproteobacteria bacterium]
MVRACSLVMLSSLLGACGTPDPSGPSDTGDPDAATCGGETSQLTGPQSQLDLSVPGRVFELDLASGDYGRRVTPGNGCAVTDEAGIGFGGAPGVRLIPPDRLIGGPDGNSEYCGLASGAPVSRGGVEVAQLNIRYALYIGRGYATATAPNNGPKAMIPFVTDAAGAEGFASRPMVFWGLGVEHDGVNYAGVGVSDTTVASYQEPELDYWPIGPGKDALYFGPAPDHAGTATLGTPVVGDEWIIVEHELDLRRDHGNPNGLNRLWVWTRDGVLAGPILDIPLTWNEAHNFAGDRFSSLDGLGYYWNRAVTRTPDDHVIYSHVAFAANRPAGQPIGPPPGFLTACTP